MTAGLGGMNALDGRNGTTTCVPERKDLDGFRRDAVVEMVMNAAEMNASNARKCSIARERTNSRLTPDQRKGTLDLVSDRSRSRGSIDLPPHRGFVDLRRSAAGDADR